MFTILFAVGTLALTGNAQMDTPADIGIDEKLGRQAAVDIVLKDENGKDATLRQVLDKPAILVFNYFRCPGICAVILSSVIEVINRMPLDPGKDYRLVAVSFDPGDTPENARNKKANYLNQMRRSFPPDAWPFLTGSAENVRALADSVGFRYRQRGDMFDHPGAIIVLTPEGGVSRYLYGTSYLPADVAMAIREAASGQVRPTISKMLSFCYSYDPSGRRYVFNVTRLAGALTLAFAGVFVIFVLWKHKRA